MPTNVPKAGERRDEAGTVAVKSIRRSTACLAVVALSASACTAVASGAATTKDENGQWVPLRAKRGGHVIANLPDGTPMTVRRRRRGSVPGFAGGPIRHCGTVRPSELRGGSRAAGPSRCRRPVRLRSFSNGVTTAFPSTALGSQARLFTGESCSAGDLVAWGNVHPWRVRSTPTDRFGPLLEGIIVNFRYASRDGRWAMVRGDGWVRQSKWFFVRSACLLGAVNTKCTRGVPINRCEVGQQQAVDFFYTGTFNPGASITRGYFGHKLNFIGNAPCRQGGLAPTGTMVSQIPIRRDGSFSATDGDTTVSGRFAGGPIVLTWRRAYPRCDTGPVRATLYRQ